MKREDPEGSLDPAIPEANYPQMVICINKLSGV